MYNNVRVFISSVHFSLLQIRQTRTILQKNRNHAFPHGSVGPYSSGSNNRNNNRTIQKNRQKNRWMNYWSHAAEVWGSRGVVGMRGESQEKRTSGNSRGTLLKDFQGPVPNPLWVRVCYICKSKQHNQCQFL